MGGFYRDLAVVFFTAKDKIESKAEEIKLDREKRFADFDNKIAEEKTEKTKKKKSDKKRYNIKERLLHDIFKAFGIDSKEEYKSLDRISQKLKNIFRNYL